MSTARTATYPLLFASVIALSSGCALDGLFLTEVTRKGHQQMPEPASVVITGRAPSFGGATVQAYAADAVVTSTTADSSDQGAFTLEFDGRAEVLNPIIEANVGGRQVLGVIPRVPGQTSVLDPVMTLDVAQLSPGMAGLDARTTTLALLVMAKAAAEGRSLTTVPPAR